MSMKKSLCLISIMTEDVWGSRCIAPHILNLCITWTWAVRFGP